MSRLGQVERMRAVFDSAFTRRPVQPETDLTDVLSLRLGDQPCVLRLSAVTEVIGHPILTPVPTLVPALIGITVSRGSPIAAYDLGLLLGRAPVAPRWLVPAAAEPGIGLVFEHLRGLERISLLNDSFHKQIEMPELIETIARLDRENRSPQETDR